MLTATTEMAVRALVFIALREREVDDAARPSASPREIAEGIGASSTYLAKTLSTLVKAGILRSSRGALGGVVLAIPAEQITLLAIVQACQGLVTGDYCRVLGEATSPQVCGFHQAMFELHQATLDALKRWNLRMLADRPKPSGGLRGNSSCKLAMAGECGAMAPGGRRRFPAKKV